MYTLDDYQVLGKNQAAYSTDSSRMIYDINNLPVHCEMAWSKVQNLQMPIDYKSIDNIVFVGMGGSAIIGDILSTLIAPTSQIPFTLYRSYQLPGFVNKRTLVIASSHSGETEETIACFEAAHALGAKLLALGTGGRLKNLADEWGVPFVRYDFEGQPRAAFGHAFVSLLGISYKLGLLPNPAVTIKEACSIVRNLMPTIDLFVPTDSNLAKQLALQLYEHIPYIYAGPLLSKVAHRWKNQLNENSKSRAGWEELPELNHNTIASYDHPRLWSKTAVILLRSANDDARIAKRIHITEELLKQKKITCYSVQAEGESELAQILWSVHFSDYVSYYLASLYRTDPTVIEAIDQLKEKLAG
jgi:glucose/mannose-6-phosphate isomerase